MSEVSIPVNLSSAFFSHRSSAFSLFCINYLVSTPRTRVDASPMAQKGARSLIPLGLFLFSEKLDDFLADFFSIAPWGSPQASKVKLNP